MKKLLKSRLFWAAAIPVALLALYALLGFKVAPGIVRDQAQAFVREHYQRELSVGEVRIQPFKLQLEVRDLALPDDDGKPMLGFERLFVDFELESLWNRAYTFKEVTIDAPRMSAVVRPDGALNLADLALPDDEPEAPPPSVWIQHLGVEGGTIEFTDAARATPFSRGFHPVGFALEDFRTTPEGGDFRFTARSREQETFEWKGRFALAPVISSNGEFAIGALQVAGLLDFLGDVRPFTATNGTMDLTGNYRLALKDDVELDVDLPSIDIRDLSLRARNAEADWVGIPSLVVSGARLALPAQSVTVENVAIDGLDAQAWMSPDGSINLQQMFAPEATDSASEPTGPADAPVDASSPSPAGQPDAARAADQPWSVVLDTVEVTDAGIAFEDRSHTPAIPFDLRPVNARVTGVSLDLSRPLPVQLDAMINGHARFEAHGSLVPDPLAADLDIKLAKARMQILQPYVLPVADLTITGGELNVEGTATVAPPERDGPELGFNGNVSIVKFRSVDNALKQDLVSFDQLELAKLRYTMAPDALSIDRVRVRKPFARVIISPEQVINIAAVLDPEGTAEALAQRRAQAAAEAARTPAERRRLEKEREAAEDKAAAAQKVDAQPAPSAREPAPPDTFPIRIREIRIDGGQMNFSDFYVQPNFSAEVQKLGGTITGLSSAYDSHATVELSGRLGEFSPVSISGELQPFAYDRYADLAMRFENIELPIFNPYSTPLAGYAIAKGKLTTDLHYRIVDRNLDAQHKIRIDQLEWGGATATQGEATLPVKFATSLLKDKDGVIKLDVPVGGTLDDPSFRIGPIVWQIIKNIIVKAVSAPFKLLGSLFAGAEEAQFVDFAPGGATLDPATAERLGALARSLVEKPELELDVPMGTLSELDQPALEERAYRAAIDGAVAAHFAKKARKGETLPAYDSLEADKKIDVLTDLVKQQTGTEPKLPEAPEVPDGTSRSEAKAMRQAAAVDYLEKTAQAGVTVPEGALAALAEERGTAIEHALLEGSGLEPTRVFKVREGKVSAHEGQVRFELGLK